MSALRVPLRSIRDSLLYQMRAVSHFDRRPYSVDSNSGFFGRSEHDSVENGSRENESQPASFQSNPRSSFNSGGYFRRSESHSFENRENGSQSAAFQTNSRDSFNHGDYFGGLKTQSVEHVSRGNGSQPTSFQTISPSSFSTGGHFGRSVNHSFENGSRENGWQPASFKTNTRPPFNFGGSENRSLENITRENITQPDLFQTNRRDFIPHGTESRSGGTSRSMDFIRGVMDEDRRGGGFMRRDSQFSNCTIQQDADFVHIKLLRNNTFVTVTDSNGNTKCRASSGCLAEMKGGPKVSRYAAEATAEHVGRLAKQMGLKSLVARVNGFTHFKKKKQAILGFREGFTNSRSDQNPIVYIEDTTRKPHNGCRLPKQRRH